MISNIVKNIIDISEKKVLTKRVSLFNLNYVSLMNILIYKTIL